MENHADCVSVWVERAVAGAPAERQARALEAALDALWVRARRTLGDVTLAAVFDRVIEGAAERDPILNGIQVQEHHVDCTALLSRSGNLDDGALTEPIRGVLVDFLTLIGELTAEILTVGLHAQLYELALHGVDARGTDLKSGKEVKR